MSNLNSIGLTLDTNCIINALCSHANTPIYVEELGEILELHSDPKTKIGVEVSITTAVEQDLDKDNNNARKDTLMNRIGGFRVIGSLEPEGLERIQEEIRRILFPGTKTLKDSDLLDIRHLAIHKLHRNDIFVTTDKGDILRKAQALGTKTGIKVQSPPDCLALVKNLIYRHQLTQGGGSGGAYANDAFSGKVSFNYSNNNGRFIIGGGAFSFDTKWSKASNWSIHCCSDAPGMAGIAIADDADQIDKITQAERYDFSSRCRTPNLNNGKSIVVAKNQSGMYAAIAVIKIQDDTRGAKEDLLEFEYVIQTNGSGDFSSPTK